MAIELIAPTTAAVDASSELSKEILREEGQSCTFVACAADGSAGLSGSESVTLKITKDNGLTWASTGDTLTAASPVAQCSGPGRFKVSKSATAAACGVYVSHNGSL